MLWFEGYALAYNPTLEEVAYRRQRGLTEISVSKNVKDYECLIGVQHGYGWLINEEVYFIYKGRIEGPWLVTDVESVVDRGTMMENRILADTDCRKYVHQKGKLLFYYDR